jgi:transposase
LAERLREQREQEGRRPAAGRNAALIQLGGRLRWAGADDDKVRAELTAATARTACCTRICDRGAADDENQPHHSALLAGDQRAVIELHADRLHTAAEAAEDVLAATNRVYRQDTNLVRSCSSARTPARAA